MKTEVSVYIIKSDGMAHREEIRQMIQSPGLSIRRVFCGAMPAWSVQELYPGLFDKQGELWRVTLEYLLGTFCEAGLVYGEKAIERLVGICGTHTKPPKCEPGTIRRIFGRPTDTSIGGELFWLNVIHRSQNDQEVEKDLSIVYRLQKQRPR